MRISYTYSSRIDLGRISKLKFTIEERIAETPWIRNLYRRFFFLPRWANTLVGLTIFGFGLALVPLWFAWLFEEGGEKVFGESYKGGWGSGLYLLCTIVLGWFYPASTLLAGFTLWVAFWLWFWLAVMSDYDKELQNEVDETKYRSLVARNH